MRNSWQLNRRTFLRSAAGTSLALPLLDVMAAAPQRDRRARMCCIYFHYGVPTPPDGSPGHQKYGYFPVKEGAQFQLTDAHAALAPHQRKLSYLGGLSHPMGRKIAGHSAGDVYLTGADISGGRYRQSISVDQVAARASRDNVRFKSQVYSSTGGSGLPSRATTLSFDAGGRPIPAEHDPRRIFSRMFGTAPVDQECQLRVQASVLDTVLDRAKSLNHRLGRRDREKMDEYLSSVREVELRVERAGKWLHIPKPSVASKTLALDADPRDPAEIIDYMRAKYDLLALAFQTDSTRIATYQLASEGGIVERKFPLAVGIAKGPHQISHEQHNHQQWSTYDRFFIDQFAYFLKRLDAIPEGDSTVLDNSMILYGSCTSKTHLTRNYPLILAGGGNLGIRQGRYLKFDEDRTPLSNLFVTMLDRMGVHDERFNDSTGELSELLS